MKTLFYVGIVGIGLGLLSLFVSIPYAERPSGDNGSIAIQSANNDHRQVSPYAAAILIAGGLGMMIVGCRERKK